MADEARLILELVDRAGGQSSTSQPQHPLQQTVSGIYAQDPNVTATELANALRIAITEAKALLAQAQQQAQSQAPAAATPTPTSAVSPPSPTPVVSTSPASAPTTPLPELPPPTGRNLPGEANTQVTRAGTVVLDRPPNWQPYVPSPTPIVPPQPTPSSTPAPVAPIPPAEPELVVPTPASPTGGPSPQSWDKIWAGLQQGQQGVIDAQLVPQPKAPKSSLQDQQAIQSVVNTLAAGAAKLGPVGAAAGQLAATIASKIPAISSALAPLAPAAVPLLVGAAAGAIPVAGVTVISSVARKARDEISGLSGDVAQAEAQASVRDITARLRTAGNLGNEIADIVDAQSRLSASGRGIRDTISEPFLEKYGQVLDKLATVVEGLDVLLQGGPDKQGWKLKNAIDFSLNTQAKWLEIMTGLATHFGPGGRLVQYLEALGKAAEKGQEGDLFTFFQREKYLALPPPFTSSDMTTVGARGAGLVVPGLGI